MVAGKHFGNTSLVGILLNFGFSSNKQLFGKTC